MAYKITYTKRFEKHLKGLTQQEKKQIKNKVEILAENPFHPSLRTKRIQGTDDLFECSVNMDIRIVWFYEDDQLIILLDVGHEYVWKLYLQSNGKKTVDFFKNNLKADLSNEYAEGVMVIQKPKKTSNQVKRH